MTFSTPTLTRTLPLIMAATFAFATVSVAQDAAAPTEAPTTAPDPATAPPAIDTPSAGNLSMGIDAGADGIGSTYTVASFDAWEQRCVRTEDGSDPCVLYQLLKDKDGNAVSEFTMFNLKDSGQAVAGATIIVPLETALTENLTMAIDTAKAKVYPFTFCSTIGCVARVGFTAAEIEAFKKGAKAVITIVPIVAPDEKVAAEISLKGFTAGYTAVSDANK